MDRYYSVIVEEGLLDDAMEETFHQLGVGIAELIRGGFGGDD
jgi:hypothetical protein